MGGHRGDMRVILIALVLCACVLAASCDSSHLRAKARLLSKLAGKHHKRGAFAGVPTYKLGYDIPHVSHSVIKPLLVTYPPTALPVTVKVPLHNPLVHRYPGGHRVPIPHQHFGLKLPHHHHHHKVFPSSEQHFHHHHHHVSARPLVPVLPTAPVLPPTPIVPVAQPSIPVPLPVAPPPVFVQPAPAPLPPSPPPFPMFPPHLHLRPVLPAQPVLPTPVFPAAPHFNYVIRPGNAVQTSYFATYPRYPLVNFQTPIVPVAPPPPVFLDRPAQIPHYHLLPQHAHGLVHPPTTVAVQPTPTFHTAQPQLSLQPTQSSVQLDHNGWSPVHPNAGHDFAAAHHFLHDQHQISQEHAHHIAQEQAHQLAQEQAHQQFPQEQGHQQFSQEQAHHQYNQDQAHHFAHEQAQHFAHEQANHQYNQDQDHHFVQEQAQHFAHEQVHHQEQGAQAYEHNEEQYHQLQHNYQQQLEYEHQQANQHQLGQEYGTPVQEHQQEYPQDYPPSQGYEQQLNQEYGAPQQLGQEYGAPQGLEGRSSEGDESEGEEQKFHNHIPLGLQPPIDKPPEPFR